MQLRIRAAWVAGIMALALSTVSAVQAQPVTVSDITETVTEQVVETAPADAETPAPNEVSPVRAVEATATSLDITETVPEQVVEAAPDDAEAPAPNEVSPVLAVEGPTVLFSGITDAVPNRFFDAATTVPDLLNPNRLLIGFHTGFDLATWTNSTFTASTNAFYRMAAMDTISFLIEAPVGFYISKISYTQIGNGSSARTGAARGGATWVVDDVPYDLGLFGANPTLSGTVDLTGQNKVLIQVSITASMFAFATANVGDARITVTSAEVEVELSPL